MATATTLPTSAKGLSHDAEKAKIGSWDLETTFPADRFVAEPKLDGWRLLVHRDEDAVHAYTRSGQCLDGYMPAIEAEVLARFSAGTWLDGEAVALYMRDGRVEHDWGKVQSILGSSREKAQRQSEAISLMVFDLISHGGTDARPLPHNQRRELLESIWSEGGFERLLLVPQVTATDDSLRALLANGFEGMVIKDRNAPYASGKRGEGWTKIKPQAEEDVVVMGFRAGENGFTGLVGSVIFGQYKDGELVERGSASGMTMQTRRAMTNHPEDWIGTVIEVAHMGIMESGRLRHPQTKRRRPDKAPDECTWSAA